MNIDELVKKTNVSKETIFSYIREGVMPIPRYNPDNLTECDEVAIKQIRIIKHLQERNFLSLSEIKKILRRQKTITATDKTRSMSHCESCFPVAQNNIEAIAGRDNFLRATGLPAQWLDKMQEWQIITPEKSSDRLIYSSDDVIIGKLIVEMDRLGLGQKNGYFPEDLKLYNQFVRDFILPIHMKYIKDQEHLLKSPEFMESGIKMIEVIGQFICHIYLKTIKQEVNQIKNSTGRIENEDAFIFNL